MRSFFGVLKISEIDDGQFRMLPHGTTMHGAQRIRDDDEDDRSTGRPEPLDVLLRRLRDGAGASMRRARAPAADHASPSSGSAPARSPAGRKPATRVTYYEIDPLVVRIARDPNLFTFLANARPTCRS